MKKLIGLALAALMLAGCGNEQAQSSQGAVPLKNYEWKLVTSWPKNFPGLGMAPERFATMVDEMSAGRLKIKVYGAGELVPAFEVFDAVSGGVVQMGHSGAYYWKGKIPAAQFFCSSPFGMNPQQFNGYLHYGGGLELWTELYKPYGVIPMAGGNSGIQMGGWFNKEINSIDDLKGLKMRLPGLGGAVLEKVGGVPVTLPGRELFTALQTGAIDATEWVGAYNDLAFGLNQAAKHYYYPGWHEPGSTLEFLINEAAYAELPANLQAIVKYAARAVNQDMLDEYTAKNIIALESLAKEHGIIPKPYPKEVLTTLKTAWDEVVAEMSNNDPQIQKVYSHYKSFQEGAGKYHAITESAIDTINQ
ncbi:TRAP transporter substrate-binding protein [Paraferrimonas sp. SM1919]|uniref:TRAP transporter substrate-binding protein n=1 Tax=Paraferrimonas sp. SM1919 TaxID=2662263 RepID=UPI0013CFDB9C|nr:TRAP transporter substrate-binding protein [Paraferrimonas sp. SM1919]